MEMGSACVKAVAGSDRILFDKWSGYRSAELIVISTPSRGDETHTSQNARCVGHPAESPDVSQKSVDIAF